MKSGRDAARTLDEKEEALSKAIAKKQQEAFEAGKTGKRATAEQKSKAEDAYIAEYPGEVAGREWSSIGQRFLGKLNQIKRDGWEYIPWEERFLGFSSRERKKKADPGHAKDYSPSRVREGQEGQREQKVHWSDAGSCWPVARCAPHRGRHFDPIFVPLLCHFLPCKVNSSS